MRWLYSNKRKVHQRAMNRLIRQMNQSIANDDLWLGRFYVKQVDAQWRQYDDKSGSELYVRLRFIDKKTGISYDTPFNTVNHWRFGARIYWKMNWFIVEYCDVWRNDDPYNNIADYRSVK